MEPVMGERVAVRFTKWGGGRHWEYEGTYVGEDEHGRWLWMPAGSDLRRPGRALTAEHAGVLCFPRECGHVLTTNAAPHRMRHYVDISTVPLWTRDDQGLATVSMVDLDLDVVQLRDGRTYVDDEDEFADHQLELGYPPELVTTAEAETRRVLAQVEAGEEPYGSVAEEWLRVSDDREGRRPPRR